MVVVKCVDGHHLRRSQRFANARIELSSQAELMKALFPTARCVTWQGQDPIIQPPSNSRNPEFSSFISVDQITEIVRQAEMQFRVSYPGRRT